jgi:hypothetical protein
VGHDGQGRENIWRFELSPENAHKRETSNKWLA